MNRFSFYLFWILAPTVLGLVSQRPELLVLIVVAFVAQRWLPDPWLYLKHRGHIRTLENQIEANPQNAEARRDLARIYLEKGQPKRAIPMVEGALEREPDSPELRYLLGAALLGAGRAQDALAPLGQVAERAPKLRLGDGLRLLGDAHMALGKPADAARAYEGLLDINSSTIEGYVKLARARAAAGDAAGAQAAIQEARATWRQIPGFLRRREWTWGIRAFSPF